MSEPKAYNCPVEATMDVLGGKWKPIVLWWLGQGPLRFSAIRQRVPGVSEKVLTTSLRELERDGVVHREVHASVPPKVVYSLTSVGAELGDAMRALCAWGTGHMERIGAVRIEPTHAEDLGSDA